MNKPLWSLLEHVIKILHSVKDINGNHGRESFLAAIGDSNDPVTWSGIPYHFLQAARRAGLLDEGLPLAITGRAWKVRRIGWNLGRVIRGDRRGGYQYSVPFLEQLWQPVASRIKNGIVVNCFQLFPPSVVHDPSVEKWFFIDQTLSQLFDYYEQRSTVGRRIADEAIEREHEGYHAAAGIIAHSHWAAQSLIENYAVAHARVHVVLPGANIDSIEYAKWEAEEEKSRASGATVEERPLRLVFIGKYWRRKGLDRLLRAVRLARREGLKATLRVIGCPRESVPADMRDTEGVEWLGFIDKRREALRFLRCVAECDVGCLLSRAEAGGIAFREYHALGLVALGADTGGAAEHMHPEASVIVPPTSSDTELAATLLALERDGARRRRLGDEAWRLRRNALWEESVRQIQNIWSGARPCSASANANIRAVLEREANACGSVA